MDSSNKKPMILGVSASLRNARRGLGNVSLIEEIKALGNKVELMEFLKQEAAVHLRQFEESGRTESLPFDKMYSNLKKLKGNKGLSNSEVALASALWSAHDLGCDIDHLSLSEYYSESGVQNEDEILQKLNDADGILISTPVYFGDRSSLGQTLIETIRRNPEWKKAIDGKLFGGIAVGAKRNGGQETTLIYQIMDMLNVNMLCIGNDSETTSQYGGTGLAGDIGTMPNDDYGLATTMGTGRRISRISQALLKSEEYKSKGKMKIQFWILQDSDGYALEKVKELTKSKNIDADIIDVTGKSIHRCLACDICPTHVSTDDEYRCIIKSKKDNLMEIHPSFLDADAIIPVVYSKRDASTTVSNYQKFLERTRYLRRGDYLLSNSLSAPLVFEEIGAHENMHIRAVTSMIRHHTVLSKPMVGVVHDAKVLNWEEIVNDFDRLLLDANRLMMGKLAMYSEDQEHLKYKPIGYVLSTAKDKEDEKLSRREQMMEERFRRNEQKLSAKIEKI
jgi:multimeric flavodoxin WrbA